MIDNENLEVVSTTLVVDARKLNTCPLLFRGDSGKEYPVVFDEDGSYVLPEDDGIFIETQSCQGLTVELIMGGDNAK